MDRNSSVLRVHTGCQMGFLSSQIPYKFSHGLSGFVSKTPVKEFSSLSGISALPDCVLW